MATSKIWALALVLVSVCAWSREAASVSDCQAAAAKPAIVDAKAAVQRAPGDLSAHFKLADAWSDAGCFSDAVQVLQVAQTQVTQAQHPANKELETRLRVARSLVGEEHYFDNLDRADADARLKRDSFRCTTLSDLEACNEAVRLKPDDPALLTAQRDAQSSVSHPIPAGAETASGQRVAAAAAPPVKPQKPLRVARAEPLTTAPATASIAPTHRYSNTPKDERSH